MNKDIVILVTGVLSSLLLFFGTIEISFNWFTVESIDAFGVLLGSIVALGGALYAVWKNTYISKKAKIQKKALESEGLK